MHRASADASDGGASTERLHLRIHGRVQGVSFRVATREQAERLDVRGWVRNLPDGTVEAYAEGNPEAVAALVHWCHSGPPGARVDAVDVRAAKAELGRWEDGAPLAGFTVRRTPPP